MQLTAIMFLYVRIYAGEHDTEKVREALLKKWPGINWDVQACPPGVDPGRGHGHADAPLYQAVCSDGAVEILTELVITSGKLKIGVF